MKFVKYTSIGLIIGFAGYGCYRLYVSQRLTHHVKYKPSHTSNPPPFSSDPVEVKNSSTTTTKTLSEATKRETPTSPSIRPNSSSLLPGQVEEKEISDSSAETNYQISSLQLSDTGQLSSKTDHYEEKQKEFEVKLTSEFVTEKVLNNGDDIKNEDIELMEENRNDQPKIVLKPIEEKFDLIVAQDTTINSTAEIDLTDQQAEDKKNGFKELSMISSESSSLTNCSLDVCPSTPCSSPLDISELDGEFTSGSIDPNSSQRSFSMTSQSSIIGEGMVAKLEQLLHQVENLKESVGEMNADLVTVRKIEPKLLTLSGDSISLGDETNGDSMAINGKDECSQTPSLEWDSNGINLLSDPDSNHSTIKEEDESLLSESLLSDKSELFSPISSGSLNSSAEPSLFINSIADLTDQTEKDYSSLQFSTSDANESLFN